MVNQGGRQRLSVIATVSFLVMLSGLCPSTVKAQSAVAGQGVVTPAGHVPFSTQANPTVLTPEQLRIREEALAKSNRPGPALPVEPGVSIRSPALPLTDAPASLPVQQPSAGTMTYFVAHDQPPFSGSSQGKASINEPSVGAGGSVVFVSSNWDAAYSTDWGNTFVYVNPYTQFSSVDGGFCCDQTVIYDRGTGSMIWQLQYNYSASTQKNTTRTAFASAANVASGGWCYYDWNPQQFGQAAGTEFDYPDVALTNNFVWFHARIFSQSAFVGTAIWRIPLGAASQCQSVSYSYFVTDSGHFTASLAQGATTTMYFLAHNSTSSERIYSWAENSGTIFWNDVGVTTWYDAARSCPGPDGLNWCNRNNGSTIGRTTWVANGVIGTMWGSSQGGGRAYPYIRVARFNESSKALINEPDIWNGSFAFIYPSVNVDDRGHLGGVLFYGGGSYYPTLATLIWDDFSATPAPWELYNVVASSAGDTSWGDYSTTRRHGSYGNTWVGTGQYKPSSSTVDTYYVWFGRQRDIPASFSVSRTMPLNYSGPVGGPFVAEPAGTFTLSNNGPVSLTYSVSSPYWLTVSPSPSGSLASGASTGITISPSPYALGASGGNYASTITFANTSNGAGNTSVLTNLLVNQSAQGRLDANDGRPPPGEAASTNLPTAQLPLQ